VEKKIKLLIVDDEEAFLALITGAATLTTFAYTLVIPAKAGIQSFQPDASSGFPPSRE